MAHPAEKRYTFEEYLAFEEHAEEKHEFFNGRIYAMSGGSDAHGRICFNLYAELRSRLKAKGTGCRGYSNDTRFSPDEDSFGTYPDAMIVCGQPELIRRGTDTLTNPLVIFEVLSPSTEAYDRGRKFDESARSVSLKEYVLISQFRPVVESYLRQDDGSWVRHTVEGLDGEVEVRSVGISVPLRELYELVEFEDFPAADEHGRPR